MDIHSHVLPGIDDGPDTLGDSVAMARAAVASGTGTLAATPHLHPGFPGVNVEELAERCRALQQALAEREIPIEIVSGAEISAEWLIGAGDAELKLASYGQRGTDVLIETPPSSPRSIETVLPHLQAKGYRVTLAHPERGLTFQRGHEWLRALVEQGLVLAVNAESVLSSPSSARGQVARRLCTEGLAHVLASDGHRASEWRPVTQLGEAAESAASLVGPERARWMMRDAPLAILQGEALSVAPPVEPQRTRRWFSRR